MAGIGDYKKGGKFTLRSGNSPLAFKEMGSSPAKGKIWDTIKRTGEKVYDKASQIGEGIKNIDIAPGYAGSPAWPKPIADFKEGYQREKTHDESVRAKEKADREAKSNKSPMKDEKSDKRPEGKVNKEGTAVWRGGKWEILSLEDAKAMQEHMAANTPEAIAAELAKQAREEESEN